MTRHELPDGAADQLAEAIEHLRHLAIVPWVIAPRTDDDGQPFGYVRLDLAETVARRLAEVIVASYDVDGPGSERRRVEHRAHSSEGSNG